MGIKIGDKVVSHHDRECIVTAILLKGRGQREYQCSYIDKDGDITRAWLMPCEIQPTKERREFGFKNDSPTEISTT